MKLAALSEKQFRNFIEEELGGRTQTIEALMVLWGVSKKLELQCNETIDAHKRGRPKAEVAQLIRREVSYNASSYLPAMENLSRAMNADFEALMAEMLILPAGMTMEQGWEKYISPIKPIVGEVESWTYEPMSQIATFEDDYLG